MMKAWIVIAVVCLSIIVTSTAERKNKECIRNRGLKYSGTRNVTKTGIPCMKWHAQSPHTHRYFRDSGDDVSNYCRNPDKAKRPWCYTVDPAVRWQFCAIPRCPEFPECNTTETGIPCMRWHAQHPHTHLYFPNAGKSNKNFCRNPDKSDRVWCYTTNPAVRWQYCNISECTDFQINQRAGKISGGGKAKSTKRPTFLDKVKSNQSKKNELPYHGEGTTTSTSFLSSTPSSSPSTQSSSVEIKSPLSSTTSKQSPIHTTPLTLPVSSQSRTTSPPLNPRKTSTDLHKDKTEPSDHKSTITDNDPRTSSVLSSTNSSLETEHDLSGAKTQTIDGEAAEDKATKPVDNRFDEHRLYDHLMDGYNKAARPVYNASKSVKVSIGISLNQIFDVDEKNQELTTHVWLDQEWHDEKLKWDPADYNGLQVLRMPCSHLWLPDIVLYNSVDDITGSYMQALAMVSFDGTVFWPPIVRMRSSCEIDITYFPFDDQICKMKLGSWAYDGTQVDVLKRRDGVDISNYISNGEWNLVEAKAIRNVVVYPCCPEPYPDVTFTLHIRRRTLYYTYNVIVPCVMLSALTLLVFWLTPENGEKVTMGLTVLLSFSVFMLLIAENMPATSFYVPLIGVYITCVMALTAFSVVLAVFVSSVQAKDHAHKPIPPSLKKFTHMMAKICCVHLPEHKRQRNQGSRLKTKSNAIKLKRLDRTKNGKHHHSHHVETCYSELRLKCNGTMETECHLVDIDDEFDHVIDDTPTAMMKQSSPFVEFEKVVNKLDDIIARQDRILEGSRRSDWTDLAEVIDRVLFYIFLTASMVSTVSILVILPLTKSVSVSSHPV